MNKSSTLGSFKAFNLFGFMDRVVLRKTEDNKILHQHYVKGV